MLKNIVLVDIGATYIKAGLLDDGFGVSNFCQFQAKSFSTLVKGITNLCNHPSLVAISTSGLINSKKCEVVSSSYFLPWMTGSVSAQIKMRLGEHVDVILINDGEAHVLSLLKNKDVNFGAISISLGTAIGFGAIDKEGNIARPLTGNNWEIGHIVLPNSPFTEFSYSAFSGYLLGMNGLTALKNSFGDDAYRIYGCYLGKFISDLCLIFRPKTVFLTGGIIRHNWNKIDKFITMELSKLQYYEGDVKIIVSDEFDSALSGLAELIKREKYGK